MVELLVEMHGGTNPATSKRWTLVELAGVASQQLGREVSHMAVHRAIKPILDERRAMLADALRLKIGERVNDQIEALDDLITKVATHARSATPMVQRKGLDSIAKALNVKLRYSGVNADGKVTLTGDADGLAAFLSAGFAAGTSTTAS